MFVSRHRCRSAKRKANKVADTADCILLVFHNTKTAGAVNKLINKQVYELFVNYKFTINFIYRLIN